MVYSPVFCLQSHTNTSAYWYINPPKKIMEFMYDGEVTKLITRLPWNPFHLARLQRVSMQISYERYLEVRCYIALLEDMPTNINLPIGRDGGV